jgi:hypothetical protein
MFPLGFEEVYKSLLIYLDTVYGMTSVSALLASSTAESSNSTELRSLTSQSSTSLEAPMMSHIQMFVASRPFYIE